MGVGAVSVLFILVFLVSHAGLFLLLVALARVFGGKEAAALRAGAGAACPACAAGRMLTWGRGLRCRACGHEA